MSVQVQGNLHMKLTLVFILKQSRNGEHKISVQCHVDLAI